MHDKYPAECLVHKSPINGASRGSDATNQMCTLRNQLTILRLMFHL